MWFCFHSVAVDEKEKPREFNNGLWSRLGDDPRANLQETVGVVDHRQTSRRDGGGCVKNDGRDSKGENKVPCRRQRKRRRRRNGWRGLYVERLFFTYLPCLLFVFLSLWVVGLSKHAFFKKKKSKTRTLSERRKNGTNGGVRLFPTVIYKKNCVRKQHGLSK